jgi:hypothetical protein
MICGLVTVLKTALVKKQKQECPTVAPLKTKQIPLLFFLCGGGARHF